MELNQRDPELKKLQASKDIFSECKAGELFPFIFFHRTILYSTLLYNTQPSYLPLYAS